MFGIRDRPVMIVEDDPDLREVMAALLESEGYAVLAAHDGADALSLLADGSSAPFLILLDWMMPNMDGEAFRRRQLETPILAGIPVVVLSAAPPENFSRDAIARMVPVVLRKPIDLASLVDVVGRYHARSIAPRA
jgi:CheY-like chemotaxis protein